MAREVRILTRPTEPSLEVAFVRDQHLRAANGVAENAYIERLIRVSERTAEKVTRRSLVPQTLELTLTCFGLDGICLPRPPIIEVLSIVYLDADDVEQTLDPDAYVLQHTGRDVNMEGLIVPAFQTVWPSITPRTGAVTVTYRAGYIDDGSPEGVAIPEDILHGQLLMIAELYKVRSESVHAFNQNEAVIRARNLWMPYRIY